MENKTKIKKDSELKEFGLTSLAVDNSTSIFLLTFMILLFGVNSYISIPKESFPEINFPEIFVNTVYFGNSASDIENLVTRPLEKELKSISEIKNLTSRSLQDYSLIVAEFDAKIDIEDAERKIKDAVDKAKSELPNDLTKEPEVISVNFSELPIMTVNLEGNLPPEELKKYAEDLQDKLEDLREISEVKLKGTLDKEVEISVDIPKMESLRMSFSDIENAIRSENITMSGGEVVSNDFRRNIRILGEFKSVKEIENVVVKSERNKPVYLKDIASVTFDFQDQTSIARSNQVPVVSLDMIKRKGENLLIASDKIKETVDREIKYTLPNTIKVNYFNDQSYQTRDMVSNLLNSIVSGVILVVLVLLFFLGLRNAAFVGLAIPLSMLMGILWVNAIGYTLNTMVLFSMILALGMLVDNAIVVVENIYRYMQEGYSGDEAAKKGVGEVALPIIASTATTLAAFIPLAFWPGLMGSFMRYLPITLMIVLSSSLFVALVINPVLTARFMKIDEKAETKDDRIQTRKNLFIGVFAFLVLAVIAHLFGVMWLRNISVIALLLGLLNYFFLRPASFFFQNKILPAIEGGYNRFIRFALHKWNPVFIFIGTFVLLILSQVLMTVMPPKVNYFPITDPLFVNVFVEMPMGKDIKATSKVVYEMEGDIKKAMEPYESIVSSILAQIGENTSDPAGPPEFGASPNKARISVSFIESKYRGELSSADAMEDIRKALSGYAGVQITVDKNQDGPPIEKPINIEISGEDINILAQESRDLIDFLNSKEIPGVEELIADVKLEKPELLINIDRESARRFGASTFGIADVFRTAVFGKEISKYKLGEDEYPINLRVDEKYRNNIDNLINQKVTFRSQSDGQIHQVPIAAVADLEYSSSFNSINRRDQERAITIYSNILKGFNANEVVAEVQEVVNEFEFSEGYKYQFTGEQQQQAEEMNFLLSALMVAIFAIFIIIVAQFNSIISPFIIILSVVFSTIGVFLGYVMTGMDIVIVMTGIGIISLAGIVVNNAIVLIDYVNILIKRKREELGFESMDDMTAEQVKDAVVVGGSTRLRPVILTAITTVLGLIPLAIGFNFNFFTFVTDLDPQFYLGGDNVVFWGTMAWTVIYGLIFATFLTLIVVPVMYWLAYKTKHKFAKLISK